MTTKQSRLYQAQENLRKDSLEKMFDYYGNWWEDGYSRMVCIPPCRDLYGYLGPIDEAASNFDVKEFDKHKVNIEGNNSESVVLTAFQKCGFQQCVLINAFESTEFIKSLVKDRKYQNLGNQVQQENNKKDPEYEIDYLLFHPYLGIVVLEVKSSLAEAFSNGKQQLSVRKSKLPQLYALITGDKAENFPPMKFFLCVPEKSEGIFVDFVKSSRPDIEFELIGAECVLNQNEFKKFWEQKVSLSQSERNNYFDSEHLRGFISALALYRSSIYISIAENALHVYSRISVHLFESEGRPSNKVPNFTTSNKSRQQQIILSEEQMIAISSDDKCQIIYGPPGTGKSLVLQYKALRIAQKYPKGLICISSAVHHAKEIENFMERNGIKAHQLKIIKGSKLNKEKIKPNDHLFVDEMGVSNFAFWKFRSSCDGTTTCVVTRKSYITDSENFGREKIDHPAFEDYKEYYLQTILRGTKEIIFHWFPTLRQQINEREQAKRTGNRKRQQAKAQTTMQFSKEFAIGHSITGTSVAINRELTVQETLNQLKSELDVLFKPQNNGEQLPLSNVAVLCDSTANAAHVRNFLNVRGYQCGLIGQRIGGNLPFLVVDDYINALSLEWPIVISLACLCTDTKNTFSLLAHSRAIAHLIVIERDYLKIQLDIEYKINSTQHYEGNLSAQAISSQPLDRNCINLDKAARCFDEGVALFCSNQLPLELIEWASQSFAIPSCSTLCDFLKQMTKNEKIFSCFAFGGGCSRHKIEYALQKDFAKRHAFKSSVNKKARILQLLKEKPQQMTSFEMFANHWCKFIDKHLTPLTKDELQNAKEKALSMVETAPPIWLSFKTAFDHFIMATSDIWFEESC